MQKSSQYIIQNLQDRIVVSPVGPHLHTLIFLHGLGQSPDKYLEKVIESVGKNISNVKIILPEAPKRHVTMMNAQTYSWFDIKYRSKESFLLPFDDVFSTKQVTDSFENVIEPIIKSESRVLELNKNGGRLIISGFSQGCGMSLHCLYHSEYVYSVLGISGQLIEKYFNFRYLFPITNFDDKNPLKQRRKIIHGLSDKLRPWDHVKVTYQGKIPQEEISLVQGMDHQINADTIVQMRKYFDKVFAKV